MPERKFEYTLLEHKADSGFLVKAPSLERLYIDAALSLTDQIVRLHSINERDKQKVEVSADNRESLMVQWLNEILYLFEQHKFLSHRIIFNHFDTTHIASTLYGELYDPARHGSVSEIKAVTYHQLQLGEGSTPEPHFFAKVFLDL